MPRPVRHRRRRHHVRSGKNWAVVISIGPDDRVAKLITILGVRAREDDKVITLDCGSGQKAGAVRRVVERMRLRGVRCRVERHEEY